MRKTISIWHEALWYNDELDKRTETTVSIIVVQEIRRIQSELILAIFARWILVAFAVLVFSDTKSRVINLLLTEFARAVLGEYRPSVFLVRTSPKRLGPYCQDHGPIFSQYGPRTRSIRYMYGPARWTRWDGPLRIIYAESCGRACRTLGVLFWLNLKRVTRIYYGNPRCGIHSAKPLQNPPKKCRKAGNYFARRKAKAPWFAIGDFSLEFGKLAWKQLMKRKSELGRWKCYQSRKWARVIF